MTYFFYGLIFLLGTVLGSFASAIAYRLPRGESWIRHNDGLERSRCPSCNHKLTIKDLVPLFSWIGLKGRCYHCGARISVRYPVIELVCGLFCLLVAYNYGASLPTLFMIFITPFAAALIVIDLQHYILPNQLLKILFITGVVYVVLNAVNQDIFFELQAGAFFDIAQAFMSAAIYGGGAFIIGKLTGLVLKRESLGFGDVKLFAVTGLWLGIEILPAFLILSGLYGVIFGSLWRYLTRKSLFPFGPALIVAFLTCFLLPQKYLLFFY